MPFAKWERVIQDASGNLVESCTVTVRRLPGLVLQPLKADYDGSAGKDNPFTVTDGRAKFYAAAGRYQISVVAPGGFTATYTDELVGTLQGQDANAYVGPGFTFAPEEETATPPSEGSIRSDEEDWADTTHLYVSDTTLSAADATSYLLGLDPGSKSIKNRVLLSMPDGSELSWEVNDVSDAGDYLDITVSGYVGPAGPVSVAPSGYVVLSREISGVDGQQGEQGDPGPQGDKGWTQNFVEVADGDRIVKMLEGYVGGEGSEPTDNVGDYLKSDGTFTSTIGDAQDVRGPAGTGAVNEVTGDGSVVVGGTTADPVVSLDGDEDSPGNNKVYGTDGSGNKGWKDDPAGGGVSEEVELVLAQLQIQVADNTNVALFLGESGNRYADSFETLTYVDTVNSVNLDTGTAGVLKPSLSETTEESAATAGGSATAANFLIVDRAWSLDNNAVVIAVSVYSSASGSGNIKIVKQNSTTNFDIITDDVFTHPGGGWYRVNLASPYTVPASGTYNLSVRKTSGLQATSPTGARSVLEANPGVSTNVGGFSADSGWYWPVRATYRGATNNATIYLGPFAAAAVPIVAKGLLMVKEVDAASADTDYELAVSRDGKSTWTDLTLAELYTAPTPTAGIRVVEGAETDISAQPSDDEVWFRFKNLNNKMVELHAAYSYWSA